MTKERAIENDFPFEIISDIAEVESWRKEIYRPIYHVHKWWAQRLGSVFRAVIIGAASEKGSNVIDLFYKPTKFQKMTVYDPFMGSGTTVGEAHKLGCSAIGFDINPVAYRAVRAALGPSNRQDVEEKFKELSQTISHKILNLYRSLDSRNEPCDVLYYFWVKTIQCPVCSGPIDLFPRFIFARNAYVKRNPSVHVVCPDCNKIFESSYELEEVICKDCGAKFNPHVGWAKRATVVCKQCGLEFSIAKRYQKTHSPPSHRMYAKLVLRDDGIKEYLGITQKDLEVFASAKKQLQSSDLPIPRVEIQDGNNTRQILNYGYRYWHELFNERQLLALALLANSIRDLPTGASKDALAILFSGVLEFNNMFASYKGEGTGAVRHMFSNHILKPERMPIEANVWGTTKSSGAFSTLYRSRLLRMLDYRESPFEIAVNHSGKQKKSQKIFNLSNQMGQEILNSYPLEGIKPGEIYLSCRSSTQTDLPDRCVDLVVTDPPFFDNVHYSELADFFYVWQELYFSCSNSSTTRHKEEVQDANAFSFANKLSHVFQECHRVLKDDGLLVFSYHHSQEEGWEAIAEAISSAGFSLVQSQPVKSEMSVASPKSQASSPIDLDVILICKKQNRDSRLCLTKMDALTQADLKAREKVSRFNHVGRSLSRNDVFVIFISQLLVELFPGRVKDEILIDLKDLLSGTKLLIEKIWTQN